MLHWLASGKQATYYGEGWANDPYLWWEDIYLMSAAFEGAQKEVKGDENVRLPKAMKFEDIGRGD